MEAQLHAAGQLGLEADVNEIARAAQAEIPLGDRLRGQLGRDVRVVVPGGSAFAGTLGHVGSSWLVLQDPVRSVLVPLHGIQMIEGLGRHSICEVSAGARRLGLGSAFRALARDRAEVVLYFAAGSVPTMVTGIIDRVGRDFLELAAVPSGEARRASNVQAVYAVPFAAVAAVASVRSDY
ncbi:hypothetical protein [Crystallibacter crystallopoietes]|uniref:hypothetical protein n=1 Tax=Crystallibacter crystallopoietes TaxID=37928 RepID=UPI001ED9A078|nr:hypothetical protein [Arthrobacter crystallopoietes]